MSSSVIAEAPTYLESFSIPLPAHAGTLDELLAALDENSRDVRSSEELLEFCRTVWAGEIPQRVPECLVERTSPQDTNHFIVSPALQDRGYYARATKDFADSISRIDLGTVLDPFAGSGYMAKAFREAGIPTIATDDYSWGFQGPAEKLDALSAVRKYGNQVQTVLLAWVPPEDSIDMEIYELVRSEYPHLNILVISEGPYGCTGSEAFARLHWGWEEFCSYQTTWALRDYCSFLPGDDPSEAL
jgi:hypothetical protein